MEALILRDALHPLLIFKPCYLLALRHKACTYNPRSPQQPGLASLGWSHASFDSHTPAMCTE